MPSLRDEITKSLRRLGPGDRTREAARAQTVVATDPREGKEYGPYRILRRLGAGGMGQVYLAIDTRLGRQAALKFLDARLTSAPEMLSRLYQEARTASSLNHPNILTIYDIGQRGEEHFIASEYVDGMTVRAAVDGKLIAPKAAIEIVTQVASALVPAHAAGVIHRDLKASNIMVRPDGLVKVIDFGLAKLSEESAAAAAAASQPAGPVSVPGSITGTVEYMSPEQARGDSVDRRSDLWSLGVVLYEMLAGKFPFDGATESHVIVGILDQPAPPLEKAASLPRGVAEIVNRALAKDLNKRYQSAGEMLLDLQNLGVTRQRLSAIRPILSPPDSSGRNARGVWLAALGTLAAAFLLWWFPFNGAEQVLGPDWFEPGPAQQVTFDGNVKMAALSPDGTFLAYATRLGGQETLHIRNLIRKSEWRLPPYAENNRGLTFSPDSQSLYYVLKDQREWGRLYSVQPGGMPRMLLDDIDGPVTFSPDGKRFAFMRRSEDRRTSVEKIVLSEVNDTGNQREIVQKINTHIGRTLDWSKRNGTIAAVIFSAGLHSSLHPVLSLFGADGAARRTPFAEPTIRSMGSPTWLGQANVIAFAGVAPWRTNQQAALYELAVTNGQYRSFPLLVDSLSATSKGDTLAAIQTSRHTSFWVADSTSLDTPREIRPAAGADMGSSEFFSWDGQNNLIFSSARPRAINLFRLHLSGEMEPLTHGNGCVEESPAYVEARGALVYTSNCAAFGNDYNLWQLDLKTSQLIELTSGPSRDEEPAVARDGSWVVYTAWPSNVPSLWKLPLGGGTPQQLSNLQASHPAVSPDGQSVLCQIRESYDGRLRYGILALSSGNVEKELWSVPVTGVRARWEPNGRAIDFVDAEGTRIWRLPLAGGPPVPLSAKTADPITDFSWNAQGTQFAFSTSHKRSDIILLRRKAARPPD